MKILWLVNIILPIAAKKLGLSNFVGGGWISAQLDALKKYGDENLQVTVLSVCDCVKDIKRVEDGRFIHIVLPRAAATQRFFSTVLLHESPDIVHIYGTEFNHTLEMLKVSDPKRTVISIQGLIGECAKFSLVGLPKSLVKFSLPKRLIYKYFGVPSARETKTDFEKRAVAEIAALERAQHIIGRTHWDKSCCLLINPNLQYHFCNEILRDEFYLEDRWSLENCKPHSIFVSQASYAIKGLHLFLPVFAELLKRYPDSKLYIAGDSQHTHSNKLKQMVGDYIYDYGAFLNSLIKSHGLENHIEFLGTLSANQMKEQYLRSNLFLSCSTLENSPNSVGEAMMLGVPIVASDVGGVSSILAHSRDGITYPLDSQEKLLDAVITIFEDSEKAMQYGKEAFASAHKIYNRQMNTATLINIYTDILNGEAQEI